VLLLAVALVVQMGGFPQPITGPLINTVLYLSGLLVGSWSGIIIDIYTPVIAFTRGTLPDFTKFLIKYKKFVNSAKINFIKILLDYITL
jgi:hypothetical protein